LFTGIVEEIGKVNSINSLSLEVNCKKVLEETAVGDSICVNGICLTVVKIEGSSIKFDLSPETLRRTSLKFIKRGDWVNLERALKLSDRLGGHILQGHVDAVSKISSIKREGKAFSYTIKIPPNYKHLLVEKGSIGVDGISLTVAKVESNSFSVAVIPHTYENTNLKFKKVGDSVNLEFDIIGKYVEAILKHGGHSKVP